MVARTRAHTNFVEYAPFVLILIALIELGARVEPVAVVAGRRVHRSRGCATGSGWTRPRRTILRRIGAMTTLVVLLALSVWALVIGYQAAAAKPAAGPIMIGAPPPAA